MATGNLAAPSVKDPLEMIRTDPLLISSFT